MLESPSLIFTLIAFLAVLGPLVFFHELGHYLVGRWCSIRADVFSIGFGRELFGWTDRRGTRWKVSLLPLGGYVQFAGDADPASSPHLPAADEVEGSFMAASLWRRALTVLAGPAANFLLAVAILTGFVMAFGRMHTPAVIGDIEARSAAHDAGLRVGDRILRIDGRSIGAYEDIPLIVMHRAGEPLAIELVRGGRTLSVTVTPRTQVEEDRFGNRFERGIIGIRPAERVLLRVPVYEAPLVAIGQCWALTRQMAEVLGQLVLGRRSITDLGGPLKIAQTAGEQASIGPDAFILFIAMISLNLGFINLLPLPMLDGGHLLFNAIEAVRRRPVGIGIQQWAFKAGFALLATLMIVVTFNDLSGLGVWRRLADLIG